MSAPANDAKVKHPKLDTEAHDWMTSFRINFNFCHVCRCRSLLFGLLVQTTARSITLWANSLGWAMQPMLFVRLQQDGSKPLILRFILA